MLLSLLSLVLSIVLVDAQGQCLTPNQQPGNCIDVKECTEINNTIHTQQLKPNKIKYLRQSECGKHNGQVQVCCPSVKKPIQQNVTRPNPTKKPNRKQPAEFLTFSLFLKPGPSQPIQQDLLCPNPPQQQSIPRPPEFLTFSSFLKPGPNEHIQENLERPQPSKQENRKPPPEFLTFSLFLKPGAIQPIPQNHLCPNSSQQQSIQPPPEFLTFSSFLKPEPSQPNQKNLLHPQPTKQQNIRPPAQGSTSTLSPQSGVSGKGVVKKIIYGGVESDPWLALVQYLKATDFVVEDL